MDLNKALIFSVSRRLYIGPAQHPTDSQVAGHLQSNIRPKYESRIAGLDQSKNAAKVFFRTLALLLSPLSSFCAVTSCPTVITVLCYQFSTTVFLYLNQRFNCFSSHVFFLSWLYGDWPLFSSLDRVSLSFLMIDDLTFISRPFMRRSPKIWLASGDSYIKKRQPVPSNKMSQLKKEDLIDSQCSFGFVDGTVFFLPLVCLASTRRETHVAEVAFWVSFWFWCRCVVVKVGLCVPPSVEPLFYRIIRRCSTSAFMWPVSVSAVPTVWYISESTVHAAAVFSRLRNRCVLTIVVAARCSSTLYYEFFPYQLTQAGTATRLIVQNLLQPNLQNFNDFISGFLFVCVICGLTTRGNELGSVKSWIKQPLLWFTDHCKFSLVEFRFPDSGPLWVFYKFFQIIPCVFQV